MTFILSQELSRHNRDKRCNPIKQRLDYKSYEISYETIEILPTYTIIASSDSVAASDTNTNISETSEIFHSPIIHENQKEFEVQELSNQENLAENQEGLVEKLGTIKSWSCEQCTFQ